MDNLLAARLQMATSLAFHIIFAVFGIGMPLMMVIAEGMWLRTGREVYLELTKRWARITAIFFAVGAVSGTVLSFELGLLWPEFMRFGGAIIGMPFSLEGFAFFTEAIFLGVYLYGWRRLSARAHWFAGLVVVLSGALSAFFVVTANSWMNSPAGFKVVNASPAEIDPIAAMFNAGWTSQTTHMILAAYLAVGAVIAGVHAWMLRRHPGSEFHRKALGLGLAVGVVAAVLQPLSGDFSARYVANNQKAKFAALEGQFKTEHHAPLRIGGWPDPDAGQTRYALEIPGGLSFLAYKDFNAEVTGLDAVPQEDRPDPRIVHPAFQLMVASGMLLLLVMVWAILAAWRRRGISEYPPLLLALAGVAPLGFLAIEAGWVVTEVGRQPWAIAGVMRTSEAVTRMPNLVVPFAVSTLLYLLLAAIVVMLLVRQLGETPHRAFDGVPPRQEAAHV
jgi:cytochrome d ubiquinol oxidase subunit I